MTLSKKQMSTVLIGVLVFLTIFASTATQNGGDFGAGRSVIQDGERESRPTSPVLPENENPVELPQTENPVSEPAEIVEEQKEVNPGLITSASAPSLTGKTIGPPSSASPPADTVPPEAVIHWDSQTRDIIVIGLDNQDTDVAITTTIISQKQNKKDVLYTLTDDAGNTFNLTLEHKVRDENRDVRIIGLEYNNIQKDLGENHYKVNFKTDDSGNIVQVHQNIHVEGIFKLNSHYKFRFGETSFLLNLTETGEEISDIYQGLHVFDLTTNFGSPSLSLSSPVSPNIINNPLFGDALPNWYSIMNYEPPEHHSYEPPGFTDTSEYMIGNVTVSVILMESTATGSPAEDWTNNERNTVRNEIQGALDWWENRFVNENFQTPIGYPNPYLNFHIDWTYLNNPIATIYEPVTLAGSSSPAGTDQWRWIREANTALGYSNFTDDMENHLQYINDLRNGTGDDWTFTIFVVDSSLDADGRFSDLSCAYAFLGGPFMVMTFKNDNYSIGHMDAVGAHETGHIFYALDEYQGVSSPTDTSGYLNIANQNHATGGSTNEACLMKGDANFNVTTPYASNSICTHSRWTIGWNTMDADQIPDILDTQPGMTLQRTSPNPSSGTVSYDGFAEVNPLTNQNPRDQGRNITLNWIHSVKFRYRVDTGGTWGTWTALSSAAADDGFFDDPEENFTITFGLTEGRFEVEIWTRNSVGNFVFSSEILTVFRAIHTIPDTQVSSSNHDSDTPSMAVLGSSIYVAWTDSRDGNAEVYFDHSTDSGSTWQATDTRLSTNDARNSFSPAIGADSNYLAAVWADATSSYLVYTTSSDGGVTWNTNAAVQGVSGSCSQPDIVVQSIAVQIVYVMTNTTGTHICYQKGTVSLSPLGITWASQPTSLITYTGTSWAKNPSIAVSGANVHVVWEAYDTSISNYKIQYVMSPDGGTNWYDRPGGTLGGVRLLSSQPTQSNYPEIGSDGTNVHIVWQDNRDGNFEIYYVRSTDNGLSWSAQRLTSDTEDSYYPAITVDSTNIHVVWTNKTGLWRSDLYYMLNKNNGNAADWSSVKQATNAAFFSNLVQIEIDGEWAHLTWHDLRDGSYKEIYYKSFKWNYLV